MRLVGTSIVCVLAAFGAAFLVARASGHQNAADAARMTPAARAASTAADVPRHARTVDVKLASQFAPQISELARPPRRHHAAHKATHKPPHHPSRASAARTPPASDLGASQSAAANSTPQPAAQSASPVSPPTYNTPSAPVQSAPSPAPSGSGGGSGSTSIGGSGHPNHGTGTTKIG